MAKGNVVRVVVTHKYGIVVPIVTFLAGFIAGNYADYISKSKKGEF